MTASELAFLALGLLLGATTGAALLVVLGSRPARREIRVTVTRDAVPRRSETLSQDAFIASASAPAPGGPGDRRIADRDVGATPENGAWRQPGAAIPAHPSRPEPGSDFRPSFSPHRTVVPNPDGGLVPTVPAPARAAVAVAIEPEPDRELRDMHRRRATGSPLERMLRGEHLAMVEVVDAVAGADSRRRRSWEVLLGGLVEAMADVAVRESVIDFPMGTAFWDTFTIEQCRRIVGALASMGYRYDGHAGWVDSRVPSYRDLSQALADTGLEPRRVRAWPNQAEIASLFAGARPAPEELIAAAGPDYTVAAMQQLVDEHAAALADLWTAWEIVRPALLADDAASQDAAVEASPSAV